MIQNTQPQPVQVIDLVQKSQTNICKSLLLQMYQGQQVIMDLEYARCRTTLMVIIGNLLVRGYFIFKRMKTQQCIIFAKKKGFSTQYKYLKLMQKYSDKFAPIFFTHLNMCIREINHMKKKQQHEFSVQICFVAEKASIQIINGTKLIEALKLNSIETKNDILSVLGTQNFVLNSLVPQQKQRQIEQDSQDSFQKLKDILYHYLDTFGQKYKTNYYRDLQKKCLTSYRIDYLINTINHMIYKQTCYTQNNKFQIMLQPMYNQIESSCWTSFYAKKQVLTSDRKDIVLSGNSRILFVDLLFLKNLDTYVDEQYRKQVRCMMDQCRSTYTEAKLKIMRITNQVDTFNGYDLIYKYQMKNINSFTKISNAL